MKTTNTINLFRKTLIVSMVMKKTRRGDPGDGERTKNKSPFELEDCHRNFGGLDFFFPLAATL